MVDSDRTPRKPTPQEEWQEQMRLHSLGDVARLALQQAQQQAQQSAFSDETHSKD